MADPQTRSTIDSKPMTCHAVACFMKKSIFRVPAMQSDLAMDIVSSTMSLLLPLQQIGFADCLITMNHLQVVGPSVRAFGMCVDAHSTLVCEPLCPAIDMLLIPHLPQPFAMLVSFFSAMPQLVSSIAVMQACVATLPVVPAVSATQGLNRTCSRIV